MVDALSGHTAAQNTLGAEGLRDGDSLSPTTLSNLLQGLRGNGILRLQDSAYGSTRNAVNTQPGAVTRTSTHTLTVQGGYAILDGQLYEFAGGPGGTAVVTIGSHGTGTALGASGEQSMYSIYVASQGGQSKVHADGGSPVQTNDGLYPQLPSQYLIDYDTTGSVVNDQVIVLATVRCSYNVSGGSHKVDVQEINDKRTFTRANPIYMTPLSAGNLVTDGSEVSQIERGNLHGVNSPSELNALFSGSESGSLGGATNGSTRIDVGALWMSTGKTGTSLGYGPGNGLDRGSNKMMDDLFFAGQENTETAVVSKRLFTEGVSAPTGGVSTGSYTVKSHGDKWFIFAPANSATVTLNPEKSGSVYLFPEGHVIEVCNNASAGGGNIVFDSTGLNTTLTPDQRATFIYEGSTWLRCDYQAAISTLSFVTLTDTPSSMGNAGEFLKVNSGGNALEFTANAGFTTEQIQDIVGAMVTGNTETNISVTYQDGDGTIDFVSTDTNTQRSDAEIRDLAGGLFTSNTETFITATYQTSDDTVDLVVPVKDEDDMTSNSATHLATQQSIKTYVDTEVAGLVASAPAALDTLNELAAAINDDASFSTTITTSIGTKLAKASNLSDLANAGTARTNLGLGSLSTLSAIDISANTNLAVSAPIVLTGDTLSINDIPFSALHADVFQTSSESFVDNDTSLMTSAAIQDKIQSFGYSTTTGTVTGVSTGTGLTGGTITGSGTISLSHLGFESLADPDADRILFWDDSAGALKFLTAGTNLAFSGTTLNATDTNTQRSQEEIEDFVNGLLTAGSNVSLTYNDSGGTLTVASTDTNTQLSGAQVKDFAGAMFTGNTETFITATYQTSDDTVDLVVPVLDEDNMASDSVSHLATQQSIKAYVDSSVTSLVASAPGALDTLNELAAAINDDASFHTTITNLVGTKLAKSSNLSDLANAGTARSNLGVDAAGTDNSTNVTLATVSGNYLSLAGQAITAGTVPVSLGGTGATAASGARSNLGLGAAAVKAVATDGSGGVANNESGLVTGNAVFDYIAAQGFGTGNGDITSVVAGTGLSGGATSGDATLNVSAAQTQITSVGTLSSLAVAGDVTVDTSTFKVDSTNNRVGIADASPSYTLDVAGDINLTGTFRVNGTAQTTADAANDATITLTAGTGLTGGGNFTTDQSSNETLTFNVAGLTVSELAAASLQTGSESFADSDTVLMTAAAIQDKITSYGYTTNAGDITGVTAGTGLSGGGSSGGVTLAVDLSELTDMTQSINSSEDELILLDNGADRRKLISEIPLSAFNNDSGFITSIGTDLSVSTVTVATDIIHDGDTNTKIGFTSDVITLGTGGSTKLTANNSGIKIGSGATVDIINTGFSDNDTSLMTSQAIKEKIEAYGYSTTTGDITGVTAGTGLSGGGSSGSVTLNVSGLTVSELAANSLQLSSESFADNDTSLMTSAAIQDKILSYGYGTGSGDITAVVAGTGLSGGANSGSATLNVSGLTVSELAANSLQLSSESFANNDTSLMTSAAIEDKILSYGYGTGSGSGDITAVVAGTGLTGGATSGSATVTLDLKDEDDMSSNSATHAASQQSIKAYVDAEVSGLVASAPGALNTLNELAAAINDDASFSSTITTSIGTKLAKASNLSDLANAGTARTNLGLGTAATLSGTGAVANGNAGLVTGDVVFDYIAAQGFGSGSGDITAVVAGTGLSGGATSGSATLNVSGLTVSELAANSLQLSSESFANNDTSLMTSAAIEDKILSYGYTTTTGDITAVVAGTALSGGANSGSATVNLSHLGIESLSDPGADRLLIWDDSAGAIVFATPNSNLAISGTNVNATDTNTTYSVGDGGLTQNNFTNALKTKLDGIDTSADVTTKTTVSNVLASLDSTDTLYIGDSGDDTTVIVRGNLQVDGATTTVNKTVVNVQNAFVFEGATADAHETTLSIVEPTADHTYKLPDLGGTADEGFLAAFAADPGSSPLITATPTELNYVDGVTSNIQAQLDAAGGASALNGLTDVISNTTNFTDSILISPDGAAPPQGGTLSSAINNVGIGKDVFSAGMTSGHSNVAIGTEAGKAVTNGHEGVLIGHHAGKGLTHGSDNVAVGAYTLDAASSASANVAVGWSALSGITGGGSNVAIGYGAGQTVSNNTNNVFVGRGAGSSLNSSNNVIVGFLAGDGISNGGNNTLIGYQAGGGMSGNADSNICLGYNAGDNISTGDNNVVIGAADVPSATGDNQLSISSGDGGVTWLTGTADSGVLIGDGTVPNGSTAGQLTISNPNADTFAHTLLLVDSEDDNSNGPVLTLYRNTASPADNDILGKINFNGEDSNGDARAYTNLRGVANDVTNGTHDGTLHMNIAIAGTQTDILAVDSTGGYGGLTHTPSGIKTLGNVVGATSTANNNYITLLAVPHATFKAVKASIHITDSSNNEVQTMDVMCHYDGSAANYTSYGIIYDGAAPIGEVEVDINSSNIRIRFKNTQGSTANIAGSIHAVCHP